MRNIYLMNDDVDYIGALRALGSAAFKLFVIFANEKQEGICFNAKETAKEYGWCYETTAKAFNELVEKDYIENRGGYYIFKGSPRASSPTFSLFLESKGEKQGEIADEQLHSQPNSQPNLPSAAPPAPFSKAALMELPSKAEALRIYPDRAAAIEGWSYLWEKKEGEDLL